MKALEELSDRLDKVEVKLDIHDSKIQRTANDLAATKKDLLEKIRIQNTEILRLNKDIEKREKFEKEIMSSVRDNQEEIARLRDSSSTSSRPPAAHVNFQ